MRVYWQIIYLRSFNQRVFAACSLPTTQLSSYSRQKFMQKLVAYGPKDYRLEASNIPNIREDEILCKVLYVGICAAEAGNLGFESIDIFRRKIY